jgi:hypothetical protein
MLCIGGREWEENNREGVVLVVKEKALEMWAPTVEMIYCGWNEKGIVLMKGLEEAGLMIT